MKYYVHTKIGDKEEMKQGSTVVDEYVRDPSKGKARIRIGMGFSSDFGQIKVYAEVELECDQNEHMLEEAKTRTMREAHELAMDAFDVASATVKQ